MEKKEFRFEDYQGNYVMNCRTKEDSEDFRKFMHDNGLTWINNVSYLEKSNWDEYKEYTCYYFNYGLFSDTFTATEDNHVILNWSYFKKGEKRMKDNLPTLNKENNTGEKVILNLSSFTDLYDKIADSKVEIESLRNKLAMVENEIIKCMEEIENLDSWEISTIKSETLMRISALFGYEESERNK